MDFTFHEIYDSNSNNEFDIHKKNNIGLMVYDDELKSVNLNEMTQQELKDNKKVKKEISYDDILASLNMVVVDGKLQFINPSISNKKHTEILNKTNFTQQQQQPQQPQPKLGGNKPISNYNSNIIQKNSYIHNKLFKNYKLESTPPAQPLPRMTRQQFQRYQIINYIKRREAQRRINLIKSKKLVFYSNNNSNVQYSRGYNGNLNKLFKL
jgi:hypothetical protein